MSPRAAVGSPPSRAALLAALVIHSLFLVASARAQSVGNVRFRQTEDDRVVVTYDIEGASGRTFEVDLRVSADGGETFNLRPRAMRGDVGEGIEAGRGKRITWDVFSDVRKLEGAGFVFKVVATPEGGAGGGAGEETFTDPVLGMEFVWVEGGTYEMGCGSWTSECGENAKPVHEVCVDGFWLGRYEVTFAEYDAYCKATGRKKPDDEGWGRGRRPVINVSWEDAQGFIKWLSRKTGLEFRLPTEAEWEYAARSGGKPYEYSWGNGLPSGNVADEALERTYSNEPIWTGYNDGYAKTALVGSFRPNGLSLYDMSGNVWEWCSDWYGDYYEKSPKRNPAGPSGGRYRVVRGGSWYSYPGFVRAARRFKHDPGYRSSDLGFRLARTR